MACLEWDPILISFGDAPKGVARASELHSHLGGFKDPLAGAAS